MLLVPILPTAICLYTDLECLEHVREGLHADQEMANDHRRAEVGTIVERRFSDTLQVVIARPGCFSSSLSERTHR